MRSLVADAQWCRLLVRSASATLKVQSIGPLEYPHTRQRRHVPPLCRKEGVIPWSAIPIERVRHLSVTRYIANRTAPRSVACCRALPRMRHLLFNGVANWPAKNGASPPLPRKRNLLVRKESTRRTAEPTEASFWHPGSKGVSPWSAKLSEFPKHNGYVDRKRSLF